MICEFKMTNFKCFGEKENVISFYADDRIKRFDCNTIETKQKRLLKTVGIYGPNNTGKSCLVEALSCLRLLMDGQPLFNISNAFKKLSITTLSVVYFENNRTYRYKVTYDSVEKQYLSEYLYEINYEPSNPAVVREKVIISRDGSRVESEFIKVNNNVFSISNRIPFMLALNFDKNETLREAKNAYFHFYQSLVCIDLNYPLSVRLTLDLMKNNPKAKQFISNFVKNCDINIEDFTLTDDVVSDANINEYLARAVQRRTPSEFMKLNSKHRGYRLPSIFFDSIGTQKIISLAGYIYNALINQGILVIDELDSSLHHIISRALVSLFNNGLNRHAQLIFTTHDVDLMDLKTLMRKDQIYLTDIDKNTGDTILIHFSDFTAKNDGVRGDEDIRQHYLSGRFGSIPTPDLFETLDEAINGKKG